MCRYWNFERLLPFFLAGLVVAGEVGAVCDNRWPEKHAFFGDLHIHTGLSADARLFGTDNRPEQAYRFARGESIPLKALMSSEPPIQARRSRPLDFAAVTDHAESMGGVSLCTNPGSPVYDGEDCREIRAPAPMGNMAEFSAQIAKNLKLLHFSKEICGTDGTRCREAIADPWKEIQQAAETWNSPCEFTTFVGYEYSPNLDGSKIHHNVIFRNGHVPSAPISAHNVPSMIDMWRQLKHECKDSDSDCDVLAIPHNSNLSNGRMFALDYGDEKTKVKQREIAELRAELEPVVEIFQQKGDSECRNGLWNVLGEPDEWCDFEKYRNWKGAAPEDCRNGVGTGALEGRGCVSRLDYSRYALAAGLAERKRIGANPYIFGVIGSTDAHDGSAGDVEERLQGTGKRRVNLLETGRMSTGGLAGVWAEENTREALFESLRRREVFATSGTRITPRFFAASDYPDGLCDRGDFISRAYATGVPMGSELRLGKGKSPEFLISAAADPGMPGYPGTLLQRMQVIKVWAGQGDELHQAVYEIADAMSPADPAAVDVNTCEPVGAGASQMCRLWRDPAYDPEQDAVYYARVIENPSCRHTGYACVNSSHPSGLPGRCSDETMPRVIQERAWTSPIWVIADPQ